MKKKDNEVELLNLQMIATILFIGSLIISMIITYNDTQISKKEKPILTNKQAANLSIFNRIFVVILTLIFLYINYQSRENAKKDNEELWPFNLQIYASELSLLATIIVLYVVIETSGEQYTIVPGINNPSL